MGQKIVLETNVKKYSSSFEKSNFSLHNFIIDIIYIYEPTQILKIIKLLILKILSIHFLNFKKELVTFFHLN